MTGMHKEIGEIHNLGRRSRQWLLSAEAPETSSSGCRPMSACGVLYAGWTAAASGYRFERRDPPFSGLIACDGGHGEALEAGKWVPCRAGDVYLLPWRAIHAYRAQRSGIWRICWVAFAPGEGMPMAHGEARVVRGDQRPLWSAIEGLQRETSGRGELAAVQHWVDLIRLYAVRLASGADDEAGRGRLGPLWERVDADLGHAWTLDELADVAEMSAENLRRLCQTHRHCSPIRYLTQLRMRRAATLLASSSQKVITVARAVGYRDAFTFSAAFVRHIGIRPTAYRARERQPA